MSAVYGRLKSFLSCQETHRSPPRAPLTKMKSITRVGQLDYPVFRFTYSDRIHRASACSWSWYSRIVCLSVRPPVVVMSGTCPSQSLVRKLKWFSRQGRDIFSPAVFRIRMLSSNGDSHGDLHRDYTSPVRIYNAGLKYTERNIDTPCNPASPIGSICVFLYHESWREGGTCLWRSIVKSGNRIETSTSLSTSEPRQSGPIWSASLSIIRKVLTLFRLRRWDARYLCPRWSISRK